MLTDFLGEIKMEKVNRDKIKQWKKEIGIGDMSVVCVNGHREVMIVDSVEENNYFPLKIYKCPKCNTKIGLVGGR